MKQEMLIQHVRTSHRTLIENDVDLIDSHDKEKKIIPGDIVPVTMGFWPTGMVFEVGDPCS
jgi:hypothetical protein